GDPRRTPRREAGRGPRQPGGTGPRRGLRRRAAHPAGHPGPELRAVRGRRRPARRAALRLHVGQRDPAGRTGDPRAADHTPGDPGGAELMTLVVTGASGFLGWHTRVLARALGMGGDVADLTDPDRLVASLDGADRVVHLAGVNRGVVHLAGVNRGGVNGGDG